MRVTNTMLSDAVGHNLTRLRARMYKAQMELATGKRIARPSDDPAGSVQLMRIHSALGRLAQHEQNIAQAKAWLTDTEDALMQLHELVDRARQLAVAGASGSNPQPAWEALATEVDILRSSVLDTLNLAHNGYHVFGGFRAGNKPFVEDAGGVVTFNGDGGAVRFEVGPGIDIQVNIDAADLLAGGDVFAALKDLADRMRAGDSDAVGTTSLPELDSLLENYGALRSMVGARMKTLEHLELRAVDTRVLLRTHLEEVDGINLETSLLEFNQVQAAYETALRMGAHVLPPSLVNFLQ